MICWPDVDVDALIPKAKSWAAQTRSTVFPFAASPAEWPRMETLALCLLSVEDPLAGAADIA